MPKLTLAVVALIFVGWQVTGTAEAHSLKKVRDSFGQYKYGYGERLSHKVHHVIRSTRNCQETLERTKTKARGTYAKRSVAYRRYVLSVWRQRESRCGHDLRAVLVANLNWWLATEYANTVFPGTRPWLISCSGSEGAHTVWVWNGGTPLSQSPTRPSGSSGAGGWMQFMRGTFYAYVGDAFGAARSRGYLVMRTWANWYSPAGQAITGGYMRWSGRDGNHWVGSGC